MADLISLHLQRFKNIVTVTRISKMLAVIANSKLLQHYFDVNFGHKSVHYCIILKGVVMLPDYYVICEQVVVFEFNNL